LSRVARFINELAGDAANGVFTESNFFPADSRPEVQALVSKFSAKYNEEPDDFNAVAYDTIVLIAAVIEKYGTDQTAIRDGLASIKNVPSVIYGKATFDPQTRRVAGARAVYLVVKEGKLRWLRRRRKRGHCRASLFLY
jgi:branched-chain amino acid transport system substrate-binding protein